MSDTIWIDVIAAKYYRIPDEIELPEGNTTLRRFTGPQRQIDVAAIEKWEISWAEAQAQLQTNVLHVLGLLNSASQSTAIQKNADGPTQAQFTSNDIIRVLEGVVETLDDITSNDELRLEHARKRAHNFRKSIAHLGVTNEAEIETWPDLLHALHTSSETGAGFPQIAQILRTVTDILKQAQTGRKEDVIQSLAGLNALVSSLSAEKKETEEVRRQHYREKIQQAFGTLPRPDIKKIIAVHKADKTLPSD
ncbi:MAG: hypothetical protein JXA21_27360 [Anaerolineae bacterium]|nr:hypothetical protein [Anaerolineae bacterium]